MFHLSTWWACICILATSKGAQSAWHFPERSTESSQSCCALLASKLPGRVSFPSSSNYTTSSTSYWSSFESALSPTCYVTPRDTKDVADTIKLLSTLHSITACGLAIRGGGHTPWAGSANIQGGITIDMSQMKTVSVNSDRTIASVGPGNIWGDVYRKMDALGLAVIGGRGSDIGVGGLTLGGGLSYYSARKGFASDNVVNFEVVLANGNVVDANSTSNADLWRALKGGSNNFGVVTRFDLAAFEAGNFWGGTIIYNDTASPALVEAFYELNKWPGFDENAALMQSHAYVNGLGFVAVANIEYTQPTANPPTFQSFTKAQPQLSSTMRISNQTDFTDEFVSTQVNGRRQLYLTTTFQNDLEMVQYAYESLKLLAPKIPSTAGAMISITIQPMTPATTSRAASKGGNVLGLDNSKSSLVLLLVGATWDNPAEDKAFYSVGHRIHGRIMRESKRRGLWNRWVYLNYADESQDPIQGYGEANRDFLRATSRKYDPKGFFQRRVSGGFKLFK